MMRRNNISQLRFRAQNSSTPLRESHANALARPSVSFQRHVKTNIQLNYFPLAAILIKHLNHLLTLAQIHWHNCAMFCQRFFCDAVDSYIWQKITNGRFLALFKAIMDLFFRNAGMFSSSRSSLNHSFTFCATSSTQQRSINYMLQKNI